MTAVNLRWCLCEAELWSAQVDSSGEQRAPKSILHRLLEIGEVAVKRDIDVNEN